MNRSLIFEDSGWELRAACAGEKSTAFFPELGGISRRVKALCAACAVRSQCWERVVRLGADTPGIWAGTTEAERKRLLSG